MNAQQNRIEHLARLAFMHYHGYEKAPEDWDSLPKTQKKWTDVVNFILRELAANQEQQLKAYADII